MNRPCVCLSITEDGRLISENYHVKRENPQVVNLSLEDIDAMGQQQAAYEIGIMVIRMLNHWNPEVFKQYPNLQAEIPKRPTTTDD